MPASTFSLKMLGVRGKKKKRHNKALYLTWMIRVFPFSHSLKGSGSHGQGGAKKKKRGKEKKRGNQHPHGTSKFEYLPFIAIFNRGAIMLVDNLRSKKSTKRKEKERARGRVGCPGVYFFSTIFLSIKR